MVTGFAGGLGNQFFQYAAGRALALRSGAELVFDTGRYHPDRGRFFGLEEFCVAGRHLTVVERHQFGLDRYRRGTGPQPLPGNIAMLRERGPHMISPMPRTVDRDTYLHGFWQHWQYFASHAGQIAGELRLRQAPEGTTKIAAAIAATEAVAIHVRRTDYAHPANAAFNLCGVEYYRRAMALITERVERPTFYIFSDDIAWAGAHLRPHGACHLINGDALYPAADLMLMADCRHFIIANSSFSWWAAWLGRDPGKIVVAPDTWFRGVRDWHPAPPDWTRIDPGPPS